MRVAEPSGRFWRVVIIQAGVFSWRFARTGLRLNLICTQNTYESGFNRPDPRVGHLFSESQLGFLTMICSFVWDSPWYIVMWKTQVHPVIHLLVQPPSAAITWRNHSLFDFISRSHLCEGLLAHCSSVHWGLQLS